MTVPAVPEVSLVVPSRGGAARLPLLLECLSHQSHDSWEVVVVLDGDIDDSQQLLESWGDRLPVRTVVFPENRGRPAALNAGLAAARGSVLVRCDDDLAPGPDFVRDHALAHRTGHIGVIGMCHNVFPETTYARVYGRPAYGRFRAVAHAAPPDERWRYWGGNVSVDRQVWECVGPYDESYRGYGYEDVDWGYRAHLAGLSMEVHPELETDHHIAVTTTPDRALRAYYSGSARRRFEAKHALPESRLRAVDPWNLAVRMMSRVVREQRIQRMGEIADRVAVRAPSWVAEKVVALVVESSSVAGYRRVDAGRVI